MKELRNFFFVFVVIIWYGTGVVLSSSDPHSAENFTINHDNVMASLSAVRHTPTNRNHRFDHVLQDGMLNSSKSRTILEEKLKQSHLVVFVAITSGPHHHHLRQAIRSTWLLPCISSPVCDYRFFIDCIEDYHQFPHLQDEQFTFSDIVFRNSCALMLTYHPNPRINYGNVPPIPENLVHHSLNRKGADEDEAESQEELPDYLFRRRYKIDWKVCFMQWVDQAFPLGVEYYVFVEDDSFICMENLIYQLSLLSNRSAVEKVEEFRTGTPMYDGFDDSSTIMSRKIAQTFSRHYLEPEMNCSRIFDHPNSSDYAAAVWMSWGNSWMSKLCNWAKVINDTYHYQVNQPNVFCAVGEVVPGRSTERKTIEVALGCISRPLIIHHPDATRVLTKELSHLQTAHLCEYMLLIDKVKAPESMHVLWNAASIYHHFHDFSKVFSSDRSLGWSETLTKLEKEESLCRHLLSNDSSVEEKIDGQLGSVQKEHYSCLFGRKESDVHLKRRMLNSAQKSPRQSKEERSTLLRPYISYHDYFLL